MEPAVGNQPPDVQPDAIWNAFLNSEEAEQKYWVVKWEENQMICQEFDELMECLRNNVERIEFTIYSTSSPLASESTRYVTLQNDHPIIILTIKIASVIHEHYTNDTEELFTLSSLEGVTVEAFQGFADWEQLSTCLRQGYTEEDYDGSERESDDGVTRTALQQTLINKDEIWNAFLNGEGDGQRYWIVLWADDEMICQEFEELMECLRNNMQYVTFTIYSTSSPLATETAAYLRLLGAHPNLRLTIKIRIASMLPGDNAEYTRAQGELSAQRELSGRVAVEPLQGPNDWEILSNSLDRDEGGVDQPADRRVADRTEVLQHFLYSGAHPAFETSEKYWAVEMPENGCRVYKSRKLGRPPLQTGLQGLLSDLGGRLSNRQQQNEVITLYCSLSPVKHECQKIKRFVRENQVGSLNIKIAGLYRVRRQSCEERRCTQELHRPPNASAVALYRANARELMSIHERVTVEAFSGYAEWQSLVQVINNSPEYLGIASLTVANYHDGEQSREQEDEWTAEDLVHLRNICRR